MQGDGVGTRPVRYIFAAALLLGLLAEAVNPLDPVWCRGAGHDAVESAWATCCLPGIGDGACATESAAPGSARRAGFGSAGAARCSDVPLGAPGVVSPTSPSPHGPLALGAAGAVVPRSAGPECPPTANRATPHAQQLRQQITTTVLTI